MSAKQAAEAYGFRLTASKATSAGGLRHMAVATCEGCGRSGEINLRKHLPLAVVAKKFEQGGWTMSRHPKCGDCSGSPASALPADWERQLGSWLALKPTVSLSEVLQDLFGVAGPYSQSDLNHLARFLRDHAWERYQERSPAEGRREWRYRRTSQSSQKLEMRMASQQPERAVVPILSNVDPKQLRRIVVELDGCFDEKSGAYVDGQSDVSVAGKLDVAPAVVTAVRDAYFAPLKAPPELQAVKADLKAVEELLEAVRERVRKLEQRFVP